jgi:transcriptional regulator with XRE-family HTH domain
MNEIDQIALRLRRLRNAFGFETVRDFAAFLNVNEQAWYHFERGRRAPTIHDAIKVADKTGASFDWIYRGLEHTLPLHVVQKIAAVPEEGSEELMVDRRRRLVNGENNG